MSTNCPVIGIIGQKGGGGKSTVTIHLAVAAAILKKQAAVIIDVDPQTNCDKWKGRRKKENVAVVAAPANRIKQTIEVAEQHGAEFIVIDTPGHTDSAAIETVRASDLLFMPVEPQMFHFDTIPSMRDLIRIGGDTPTWLLVNRLHPAATSQAERLKKLLTETYGMPVCPVHLSRLDIYANAPDVGLTALEEEPDGRAADEIRQLYKFTCQQLNNLRNQHVKTEKLATSA